MEKDRRKEITDMLESLSYAKTITTWEADFVESLQLQLAAGKTLTEKQLAVLDKTWDRVFER